MPKRISADLVSPGMVLHESVTDSHGRVLLPQGSVLIERAIALLKTWGIIEVTIADSITPEGESGFDLQFLVEAEAEAGELFRSHQQPSPFVEELFRLSVLHIAKVKMRSLKNGN
jgi:hypothetical protein